MTNLFIGLMSGTSLDGVDGVLARFLEDPRQGAVRVLGHVQAPLTEALRAELLALNQAGGTNELHRAALAGNGIASLYASVVAQLLQRTGTRPAAVRAIGAHGQTVRHRPGEFDGVGYSLQLLNPALLAERSGIAVVADLRSRDVAAGGQGAPLVPAFHRAVFAQPRQAVAVLNLGGIANLSFLPPSDSNSSEIIGFDCGPGNAIMDHWAQRHLGSAFDAGGAWAASGSVLSALLQRMLTEPYFAKAPPKSTGRDLFHPEWLRSHLDSGPQGASNPAPSDVQATLTELTARTCADAVRRYGADCQTLIVCGGGAYNLHLMRRLQAHLAHMRVAPSGEYGLPPLQVEAAAFAWLAQRATKNLSGNLPGVTGAIGPRVLGAIYPA